MPIIIFLWGSRHIFYVNTKYRTSSQNTTKFIVLCCTICFTTTCFGTFSLGHLQVVYTRLEANVSCIQIYYINDDIAVIIVQLKSYYGGYYGWALALGVGWQGWNKVRILLSCNYSLEWLSLCCSIKKATHPL